jgi:hypothetical protein
MPKQGLSESTAYGLVVLGCCSRVLVLQLPEFSFCLLQLLLTEKKQVKFAVLFCAVLVRQFFLENVKVRPFARVNPWLVMCCQGLVV